ncbi:MAG: signal peptidase I [Candidatus Aenigmarchaeota archaeon ex4484_52]|nr:MAG: signal peptidase I [Candidatus Aenigmarchaeota archaeon ex4484_52]
MEFAKIKNDKISGIFVILIIAGILLLIIWQNHFKTNQHETIDAKEECPVKIEYRTVRGDSLSPLIKDRQKVKIFFSYYDCRKIKKEDIIIYDYSGNKNALIKIIKGLPKDNFSLKKINNEWNILINNNILKNSLNQSYILDNRKHKMLFLYERDYNGIIPNNTYLILGNLANGSIDSSKFGFVDKKQILGKVEILK